MEALYYHVPQLAAVREIAETIPLLVSPNMSTGVNLMFKLAGEISSALPDFDVEIVQGAA